MTEETSVEITRRSLATAVSDGQGGGSLIVADTQPNVKFWTGSGCRTWRLFGWMDDERNGISVGANCAGGDGARDSLTGPSMRRI